MTTISPELGTEVTRLCREFLGGAWNNLKPEDARIRKLAGGMSNLVYMCSLPSGVKASPAGEPRHVLLRLYGSHLKEDPSRLTRDAVVFALLAERRLGPRLHGIFPGGRLEEYIPCRALRSHELSNPHIARSVATKMASLHSIDMPLSKQPRWLFFNIKEWLKEVETAYEEHCTNSLRVSGSTAGGCVELSKRALLDEIMARDLASEIETLEEACARRAELDSMVTTWPQVAFCHNDLQAGNILLPQQGYHSTAIKPRSTGSINGESIVSDGEGSISACAHELLTFIDYEYSSYNYRAFDIANHMLEWCMDYHHREHPFFRYEPQKYPSRDQQIAFVQRYLQAAHFVPEFLSHGSDGYDYDIVASAIENQDKQVERLLQQVKLHSLSSHMLYGVWALAQHFSSSIRFGYLEYSHNRLSCFSNDRTGLLLSLVG